MTTTPLLLGMAAAIANGAPMTLLPWDHVVSGLLWPLLLVVAAVWRFEREEL